MCRRGWLRGIFWISFPSLKFPTVGAVYDCAFPEINNDRAVIDRAFYEVVSCQPPFFKESFLPLTKGEVATIRESHSQYSWTVSYGLIGFLGLRLAWFQ